MVILQRLTKTVALRKESVDRNKQITETMKQMTGSLSARRAWIEMGITRASIWLWVVALRKESVDRNSVCNIVLASIRVVALRKESVDRNGMEIEGVSYDVWSLSARRAWIEITYVIRLPRVQESLSARRAWIEIA